MIKSEICDIIIIGDFMSKTKKIVFLAILAALASVLSIADRYLSGAIFPTIPGAKIGIANIIILIALINYDFKDTFILVLLKALIGGLLAFGLTSFIIGGIASFLSFVVMYLLMKLKDKISLFAISIAGAIVHTTSQLFTIKIMYGMGNEVFAYGFYLYLIAIISAIALAILAIYLNKFYINIYNKKEDENKD